MSKRKTFTIGDVTWTLCDDGGMVIDFAEGVDSDRAYAHAHLAVVRAHAAALDEIERLKAYSASIAFERSQWVKSYEAAMLAIDQIRDDAADKDDEIELLKDKIAELERSLAIATASVTDIPAEPPPLGRLEVGYTWAFADGYGPVEDRDCDVYHHGECIGSAPDRASVRALIERHKVEVASAAQRQTPESRQGKPVGLSDEERAALQAKFPSELMTQPRVPSAATARPAGLSDEERAEWIASINKEINAPYPSATYILRNIRRIVERLP